jgi:hypothetical protein
MKSNEKKKATTDKQSAKDLKSISKGIELDDDIRNDIEQTEVNPHVQKRSPLNPKEENDHGGTWDSDETGEDEPDEIRRNL